LPRPDKAGAAAILRKALDLGYDLIDTASLYGFGANEELIGETLSKQRSTFTLASKGGMGGPSGRSIDSTPAVIRKNCEESLKRLQTDVIDLYYLHRWDKKTPLEDIIGEMAKLVAEGKVRAIGLSEVSAATLRKAHAVHPIAAVQSEYSLWTRNPEIAVLDACRDLGVSFVAFSPVARGYLAGSLRDVSVLDPKDLRANNPRFAPDHYAANLKLLDKYEQVARRVGVTPAQAALCWLLSRGSNVIAIPGTTSAAHLAENFDAGGMVLPADALAEIDQLINQRTVSGPRYQPPVQAEIDTEEFA
jgi:aryl-alcohol dehydrogenase-like predicted oxidoreductase